MPWIIQSRDINVTSTSKPYKAAIIVFPHLVDDVRLVQRCTSSRWALPGHPHPLLAEVESSKNNGMSHQ